MIDNVEKKTNKPKVSVGKMRSRSASVPLKLKLINYFSASWPILSSLLGTKERGNPIVPERTVSSQTLMIVVAIMSFLTCLTFALVTIVWHQATTWQNDISQEVTIKVRPVDGVNIDEEIEKSMALARRTPGISDVYLIDDDTSTELLEPWLGQDFDLGQLPIPRMIVLELDSSRPANLNGLAERISTNIKGASLDDHRLWRDRLKSTANAIVLGGFSIMVLMLTAMALSVTFATHGAMMSNQDLLEVLHFVGGQDTFIASEFQKRFLSLGLKGALMGGGLAILFFSALNLWARLSDQASEADQLAALFGRFQIGYSGFLGALLLILLTATLTSVTSRFAVFRYLTKMS